MSVISHKRGLSWLLQRKWFNILEYMLHKGKSREEYRGVICEGWAITLYTASIHRHRHRQETLHGQETSAERTGAYLTGTILCLAVRFPSINLGKKV
ncbi:hypothetical protein P175DRAFT_0335847 [Aspergillus ochraceoroseus IBT 24754]|uniref:Uncharacterized protein n=1 Tax=Aspergillus ochraceoroseus IBT 24754 TaxID=1392256 RepID=A0A2T5LRE1_9EURO|nr:uncharacterized protein P175DRAFT_0335847 [Aspergillus ochraceoroseus IBT 24754]PTU18853.1 hypothetical protein P175DRAFT_0335847 [Aspergillus ochraceoroseus IBT 24754]